MFKQPSLESRMFHAIPTSVSENYDFGWLPVQVKNTYLDHQKLLLLYVLRYSWNQFLNDRLYIRYEEETGR